MSDCAATLDDPFSEAASEAPLAMQSRLCGACLANPPPFARVVAPWIYDGAIADMIQRIKFNGSVREAKLLGTLLADRLLAEYEASGCARTGYAARDCVGADRLAMPDLVVPVPLHWRRLARRGHNQSALIAAQLGRSMGIPVANRLVRRRRHTRAQSGLSRSARQRNLVGAFALRRPLPASRVAVVDDVMTTGATLRAIAGLLSRAGAIEIHVWLLARTPPRSLSESG